MLENQESSLSSKKSLEVSREREREKRVKLAEQ